MRDAATVLEIIRERGRKGLPLERVYRCLFNPDLFLLAYGKLYRNAGAMTRGITRETVDGMSLDKIETIITVLRQERYRWTPVRRTYIDKKGTRKKRPLGLPTWSDKLVQEVIRQVLEAYYEPQFSDRSHGFRPGRGCHTALGEIYHQWHGTVWFIEGDISDCFGSLDHSIMVSILAEKIHDGRFLRLISGLLGAGYLEDWRYHRSLSGAPQGGVVSPVLSNIYLDRLDAYIEQTLLPAYNQGDRRTPFRPYMRLWRRAWERERRGDRAGGLQLRRQMKTIPSRDPHDPGYRRLRYCRYADDWLLGFAGPRREAEEIKDMVGRFLHEDLKLELSPSKTLITHGRTRPARFLGYEVAVLQADHKHDHRGHRSINAAIGLKVPIEVIHADRGDPHQVHALPAPRRTDPTHRTHRRYCLQHRRPVPGRVPGRRGVLQAGVQPPPARSVALRHGTVVDQDTGPEVPDHRAAGLPTFPCRTGHRTRTTARPAGHRGPRRRQETAGSAVGWDQPGAGPHTDSPQRRSVQDLEWSPVRTRATTPGRHLRTLRLHASG